VNGWLHGSSFEGLPDRDADRRKFLVRTFRPDDGGEGVARAFVSDSFKIVDHLDALTAALDGVRQAGVPVEIDGADLTDRRMYVRVVAPQVAALAPKLLEGSRNPFGGRAEVQGGGWTIPDALWAAAREGQGYKPGEEPVLFAGFVISNSEVGEGAFS